MLATGSLMDIRRENRLRRRLLVCSLSLVWTPSLVRAAGDDTPPQPEPIDTSSSGQPERPTDRYVVPSLLRSPRQVVEHNGYTSVQVNVDDNGNNISLDAANEPSIAVDPTNPNNIVIGWRQFDHVSSNFRQAGYSFSTDAGRTWHRVEVIQPGFFRSDPVLDVSPDGVFYYMSLQSSFVCDLFRSADGGASWPDRFFAYGGDKQWMTVDRTGGPGHGNIYMSWSSNAACCGLRIFTRSLDGGATWMDPITIPNRMIFGTLGVGSGGEVYVCGVNPSNFAEYRVAKSSNAWNPNVMPTFDFSMSVNIGGTMRLSTGPNPAGLLGQPWIAVDTSGGRHHGTVYLCGSADPADADNMDVRITKSVDGGLTWSPTRKLNTDNSTLH
ncbi:MAG: hypothetical protein DCC65_09035 [Planctomycetota bacterium]|nr:MAG: hypothetical protein DCC65_09035 [Planctomycetota bacterium]